MSSFNDAILILKPASYKAGTLYSVKPNGAAGDFTVARASTSTRVNSDLKLEEMAINVPLLSYETEGGCPHLETHAAYTQILTYSNEFDEVGGYWALTTATLTGGQTAPSVDYPTGAYLFTATGANATISLTTPLTITNAKSYTNSIFVKRVTGTGNILIKDINNAETVVSSGTDVALGYTRYDVTSTSTSTSGQIGIKLATSGDEVLIFGANLSQTTYAHPYAYTNGATATVTDTNEQVALPTGVTTVTLTDYLGVETVDSSPADPYIIPVGKWSKLIMT